MKEEAIVFDSGDYNDKIAKEQETTIINPDVIDTARIFNQVPLMQLFRRQRLRPKELNVYSTLSDKVFFSSFFEGNMYFQANGKSVGGRYY